MTPARRLLTRILFASLAVATLPFSQARAASGVVKVVAINTYAYPPFKYADGGGLSQELVNHLNQHLKGRYQFDLQHLPRMRLMRAHLDDPKQFGAVGLLLSPIFIHDDRRTQYLWSAPVFEDHNVLIFAGSNAPAIRQLSDLDGKLYGGVHGYRYTGLESKIKEGKIKLALANDEVANVRKLLAGRIDFTQVNRFGLQALLAQPEFAGKISYVRSPSPYAFTRHVFVGPERPELLAAINQALVTLPCNPDWQALAKKADIVLPPCSRQ